MSDEIDVTAVIPEEINTLLSAYLESQPEDMARNIRTIIAYGYLENAAIRDLAECTPKGRAYISARGTVALDAALLEPSDFEKSGQAAWHLQHMLLIADAKEIFMDELIAREGHAKVGKMIGMASRFALGEQGGLGEHQQFILNIANEDRSSIHNSYRAFMQPQYKGLDLEEFEAKMKAEQVAARAFLITP